MADVDGTSSNHTFSPGNFDMANITSRGIMNFGMFIVIHPWTREL